MRAAGTRQAVSSTLFALARLPAAVSAISSPAIARMPFGFYIIMAAQFFSSLADNALLVAAIALLIQMAAPEWMTPLLKFFFTVSYVVFAAFVGAFADSMPKGRVMFITNLVKIAGCLLLFVCAWLACARRTVLPAGAARLRRRRTRRRRLLAGQVRHPHRVPAAPQTGRRQRLDRGADGRAPSSSARCSAAC